MYNICIETSSTYLAELGAIPRWRRIADAVPVLGAAGACRRARCPITPGAPTTNVRVCHHQALKHITASTRMGLGTI